ncbi:hypothetical protein SCHPADRAFT_840321 [Schizopora paradoxa]|uniref:Inhibitor of growth protein N-terminal histone-binding domain-containing protein n=1 Tax=Schizopora paradoxa TaxID=27342 RepID=A0A0H2QYT2_9AGAM|nr:hypothetical protein SCHPADRAFT_840321 [Schizopora paradoxa]
MPTAPPVQAISAKQYSLSLLSEYAHTLDALPLDLSRIFADLRGLGAVLTSTVSLITAKDREEVAESAPKEAGLWLLGEIETAEGRAGAGDEIRIATQAEDALQTHASHLMMILLPSARLSHPAPSTAKSMAPTSAALPPPLSNLPKTSRSLHENDATTSCAARLSLLHLEASAPLPAISLQVSLASL